MKTYTIKLKYDEVFTTTLETNIHGLTENLLELREEYAFELNTTPEQIEIVSIELIENTSLKGYYIQSLQKIKALNK